MNYAEGIYMGYRYYETVAAEIGGEAGEAWYDANTVYSFGHGLSYTTFTQEIKEVKGDLTKADGEITVVVEVENTGAVAGKEVVQLYATKPYYEGGIEKAACDLVGFTKTSKLAAGAKETVEITIAVKDLASFDYDDRNVNDFCGYELEEGEYVLSIRANSHDVLDSIAQREVELLVQNEVDALDLAVGVV
jgi:beta-glucosidase